MSPRRLKLAGRSARGSGNQPPYGVAFTAGAADGVSIVVGAADCVTVSPAPLNLLSACACWPVPKAMVRAVIVAIIAMPRAASAFAIVPISLSSYLVVHQVVPSPA